MKESWKELKLWAKNLVSFKELIVSIGFLASIGGHIWGYCTLNKTQKDRDNFKVQRDSIKVKADSSNAVIINMKYGN